MNIPEALEKLSEHQTEIVTELSKLTGIVSTLLKRIEGLERKRR